MIQRIATLSFVMVHLRMRNLADHAGECYVVRLSPLGVTISSAWTPTASLRW
jgi:hypothetical protein